MPSPIIQQYLDDPTVDVKKRKALFNDLEAGKVNDAEIEKVIKEKFGDKYGSSSPTAPESSGAQSTGKILGSVLSQIKNPVSALPSAVKGLGILTKTAFPSAEKYDPDPERQKQDAENKKEEEKKNEFEKKKKEAQNLPGLGKILGAVGQNYQTDLESRNEQDKLEQEFEKSLEGKGMREKIKDAVFEGKKSPGPRGLAKFLSPIIEGGKNFGGAVKDTFSPNATPSLSPTELTFKLSDPKTSQEEKDRLLKQFQTQGEESRNKLSNLVGSTVGLVTSPFAGAINAAPVPNQIKSGIGAAFSVPGETAKTAYEDIAPALGADPNSEQFQKDKEFVSNIANAVLLGKGIKNAKNLKSLKKVNNELVKPTRSSIMKAIGEEGIFNTAKTGAKGGLLSKIKGVGQSLYESAIPKNAKEAELLQNFEASGKKGNKPITVGETALRQGIVGGEKKIGVSAKKAGDVLWNEKVKPALQQSEQTITRKELLEKAIKQVDETIDPGRKADLAEAMEVIKEEFNKPEFENMKLDFAQRLKSSIDKTTPQKAWQGKEIGMTYKSLKNTIADTIRELTYKKLSEKNIKRDYFDLTNLRELEKLGIEARTGTGLRKGFGSFWSTVWDRAITPVATRAGKFIYKIGDKEFSSPVKVKSLSELAEKQGLTKKQFIMNFGLSQQNKAST